MPFVPAVWNLLNSLRQSLPQVTFLVLRGEEFPETPEPAQNAVRLIEPRLKSGDEERAKSEWDFARSVICT